MTHDLPFVFRPHLGRLVDVTELLPAGSTIAEVRSFSPVELVVFRTVDGQRYRETWSPEAIRHHLGGVLIDAGAAEYCIRLSETAPEEVPCLLVFNQPLEA